MPTPLKERIEALTSGELEVLTLASQHLRSAEIAHRVSLSPKTVDNRISKAMRKLEVSDRDSAIRLLVEASGTPWGKSLAAFSSLAAPPAGRSGTVLSRLPWPWPTEWRPENDHPFAVKFLMVLMLSAAMMVAVAMYLFAVILIDRSSSGSQEMGLHALGGKNERRATGHDQAYHP